MKSLKEDIQITAEVKSDKFHFKGIRCEVHLPETIDQYPVFILFPDHKTTDEISKKFKFEVKGDHLINGQVLDSYYCSEVFFKNSSASHGNEYSENRVVCEPHNLKVTSFKNKKELNKNSEIVFWINPNWYIQPFDSVEPDFDRNGTIRHNLKSIKTFKLNERFEVKFVNKYFVDYDHPDFVTQKRRFYAEVSLKEGDYSYDDINQGVFQYLDDFLLVASFISRKRTIIYGWNISDRSSLKTFYRGNYSFHRITIEKLRQDGLVSNNVFQSFTQDMYDNFQNFDDKKILREVLHSCINTFERTEIETRYLMNFAGIETIVLYFRKKKNLVFNLNDTDWKSFSKYMKKCIKNCENPPLDEDTRKKLYSKISELNRVSFKEVFELFCLEYKIDSDDLWPVFKSDGVIGLTDIRNKLVHGDNIPPVYMDAVFLADEHLNILFQRMIIKLIGISDEDTKVGAEYLKGSKYLYSDINEKQKLLSEYVFNHVED